MKTAPDRDQKPVAAGDTVLLDVGEWYVDEIAETGEIRLRRLWTPTTLSAEEFARHATVCRRAHR